MREAIKITNFSEEFQGLIYMRHLKRTKSNLERPTVTPSKIEVCFFSKQGS